MYVGTYLDRQNNLLYVSERINGNRVTTTYPLIYEYLVPDDNGYDMGIDDQRLKKITLHKYSDFSSHRKQCQESGVRTYEMNFNLVHKVLYQNYKNCQEPKLHKAFFDIEVDYDPAVAGDINTLVSETPCAINAVSIYLDWLDKTITLTIKPDNLSWEEAKDICNSLEDTFLCNDEKQLIDCMIKLFDDADVISGWNSDFFDIPYIIGRTIKIWGSEKIKEYCLWNQPPLCKEVETYGRVVKNYSFVGKWSVDYLGLYKKHTPNEHESYSLDNISYEELGDRKVKYEGTLTRLYFDNFKLFLEYNRQDTNLLARIDKKLNYINIHNRQAHSIPVTLEATMGTVAWFDQAVINNAHDSGYYVPDRIEGKGDEWRGIRPPGAFVQDPVVGMHEWISDTDLNSLYPSTIRCLNMSPETIVAQVKLTYTMPYLWKKIEEDNLWFKKGERIPAWGEAWGGDEMFGTLEYQKIMNQTDDILELQLETGECAEMSAKEIYNLVFSENSNLCISAFGTLFRTDKQGLVAKILSEWYADRKSMKDKSKMYRNLKDGLAISDDIVNELKGIQASSNFKEYDIKELKKLVDNKDISGIRKYMFEYGLMLTDNIIEPVNKEYYKEKEDYWDLEQYLRKINLNSSYGALLNSGSTFYDFRLGASTTASGRKIVQHMASKLNEIAVGTYKHTGGIVVYGDTDSTYFALSRPEFKEKHPDFVYNKENVIKYVDEISQLVDSSYADHVKNIFHVTDENSKIIKAAREIVATRGLYVSKKRYALMVFDNEGERYDVHGKAGKLKIKGLQIQRSDTPMIVRKLLKNMMESLLSDGNRDELVDIIKTFYNNEWNTLKPWEKGTPKAVNGLTKYTEEYKLNPKARVPGHVMASINYNRMLEINGDTSTTRILDGNKIVVCKLKKNNPFGMTSIAYPRDLNDVPEWFSKLPFDEADMSDTIVDTTMDSIFGSLNWNLSMKSAMQTIDDDLGGFLTLV